MGKNNKAGSLKVIDKMKEIIVQYKIDRKKHDLVFPELKVLEKLTDKLQLKTKIANANSRVNDALKKIEEILSLTKTLRAHKSRHTFGYLAGDKISVQKLQKLYRHTMITTTVNYQGNFMDETDDALEAVVGV
jgi:integrase